MCSFKHPLTLGLELGHQFAYFHPEALGINPQLLISPPEKIWSKWGWKTMIILKYLKHIEI